jgi:hypothetical protein
MGSKVPRADHTAVEMGDDVNDARSASQKKGCDYVFYTLIALLVIAFISIVGVHLYQKSIRDGPSKTERPAKTIAATHYTKLDFAADEWYKPIYSLFNGPATYKEAEKICKTPLMIGEVKHDQTLPSVHMYDALINKAVEKMLNVYGGNAMWTGLVTYTADMIDLENELQTLVYGLPEHKGVFSLLDNAQSFCPPFNDQLTVQQVWKTYKATRLSEEKYPVIRLVKDFTYSNKPKCNWPTGWFPGCLRPYDPATDPKELNFVCQTNFIEPKDIQNWSVSRQKLPFHLNRMETVDGRWDRQLPSSDIDSVLASLKLIPVSN